MQSPAVAQDSAFTEELNELLGIHMGLAAAGLFDTSRYGDPFSTPSQNVALGHDTAPRFR
jgi:hypothetical protein